MIASPDDPEDKAIQEYVAWKAHARRVRALFQNAGMASPPALAKLLGEEAPAERSGVLQVHTGTLPSGFSASSWIRVPIPSLSVRALALAVLRQESPGGKTVRELVDAITAMRPETNEGSIANLGLPLTESGVIKRHPETGSWTLVDNARAPLMHEGAAWGPIDLFTAQEVAAYRREAIKYLLRKPENKNGLQQGQIVDQLRNLKWMVAPVTKDVVKLDVNAMADDGTLKRVAGTGKVRLGEAQEVKQ